MVIFQILSCIWALHSFLCPGAHHCNRSALSLTFLGFVMKMQRGMSKLISYEAEPASRLPDNNKSNLVLIDSRSLRKCRHCYNFIMYLHTCNIFCRNSLLRQLQKLQWWYGCTIWGKPIYRTPFVLYKFNVLC